MKERRKIYRSLKDKNGETMLKSFNLKKYSSVNKVAQTVPAIAGPSGTNALAKPSSYSFPEYSKIAGGIDKVYDMYAAPFLKQGLMPWTKQDFLARAQDWKFIGNKTGYISFRKQNGGHNKITGSGGNALSVAKMISQMRQEIDPSVLELPAPAGSSSVAPYNARQKSGQNESIQELINTPTWTVVTADIRDLLLNAGMISIGSKRAVLIFMKIIPSVVFGLAKIMGVLSDGGIKISDRRMQTANKTMVKYYIANPKYFDWLYNQLKNPSSDANKRITPQESKLLRMALGQMLDKGPLDSISYSGSGPSSSASLPSSGVQSKQVGYSSQKDEDIV